MDHNIHPVDTQILEHIATNYHKRLFLEPWHSTLESATLIKRKPLPCIYLLLILKKNQKSTARYGLVAQAVTNLKIAILTDKGRRKPLQIQNRKRQQIG